MYTGIRGRRIHRRGVTLLWVAISMFLLIAFVGLALDTGFVLLVRHQLQNAADAASLASVAQVQLNIVDARNAAVDIAASNDAAKSSVAVDFNDSNAPEGEIVVGRFERFTRIFTPQTDIPNAVKVVARRTTEAHGAQPILFGPAITLNAVTDVNITTSAIAMIQGATGAGLITLCPYCECSLAMNGNMDLIVGTTDDYDGPGAVQINGEGIDCPVCANGTSVYMQADEINMADDSPPCPNGQPTIDADINPQSPEIPDPLAGVPAPALELPDLGGIRNDSDFTNPFPPGYYSEGIRITDSNVSCVLQSGVYYLDNVAGSPAAGLFVNGGNLNASAGVMFYIAGQNDGSGNAVVYLGGNGLIDIRPMDTGVYANISIFQARDNTNEANIIGTSMMNLEGIYYFPVAHTEVGGDGIALGNQLIAWTVAIQGTGAFTIEYDGSFPPAAGKVFLVE